MSILTLRTLRIPREEVLKKRSRRSQIRSDRSTWRFGRIYADGISALDRNNVHCESSADINFVLGISEILATIPTEIVFSFSFSFWKVSFLVSFFRTHRARACARPLRMSGKNKNWKVIWYHTNTRTRTSSRLSRLSWLSPSLSRPARLSRLSCSVRAYL